MGMTGLLFAVSVKRKAMLDQEPELLVDVIEARREQTIPGLLDLDQAWHALDVILGGADGGELGDAIVARKGRHFGPNVSFGRGRLLAPKRVVAVSRALDALDAGFVSEHYGRLTGVEVHGGYGPKPRGPAKYADELGALANADTLDEVEELGKRFELLREFYRRAAQQGDSVLAIVV